MKLYWYRKTDGKENRMEKQMTDVQFESAMHRICQGDKQGLKDIYEAYIGLIYSIVKDVVQSRESAEDITSDFFIKLWDKADSYKSGMGHKTWMTTIARNMSIDYLRKSRKEEASELLEEIDPDAFTGQEVENESPVEQEVIANLSIKEAFSRLKESERQIMNMKILGDMTFQEIARALSIPIGTVTWRYQNAVKKLRRCGYGTGF
ncbi:MAG: sigma-70 family RNA polymerase sigma factor [Lachnospiraceae bacterium]|nr:sigma-70 family RNA polymerase sigma factor [Lachnospiraceae bacterium]